MQSRHLLVWTVFIVGSVGLATQAEAQKVRLERTVTFSQLASRPSADSGLGNEIRQGPEVDEDFKKLIRGSISPARVPSAHVPRPNDLDVTDATTGFLGFNGLTQREQRLADGGNQFTIEPPDQALAVGNGFVVESVNLA